MDETVVRKRRGRDGRDPDSEASFVGPYMEILGSIDCEGALRVSGRVGGPVRTSASLFVEEGGRVVGDAEADEAVVAGTLLGNIVSARRVELHESCQVEGDIRTERMKVDEGARFEGRLRLGACAPDDETDSPASDRILASAARTRGKARPRKADRA